MKHKQLLKAVLVLVMVLAHLPWSSRPARAFTYTVTNTKDSGAGSLRQAIIDANFPMSVPPHLIQFKIDASADLDCDAGTGVCTIQPTSALPALTAGSTTIDGYTQTGAAQATGTTSAVLKIVIDGSSAGGSANGLIINSANNTIRGLVINRFANNGVDINGSGATGNTVSGNYIGTDATGTLDRGNTWRGVRIRGGAQNNTVGGDTVGERNVISGNNYAGVSLQGSSTTGNIVSGNYIGTDASGTLDLGNSAHGVFIQSGAQNNTVGGDMPAERNVISGSDGSGVAISESDSDGNTVSGNYIGLAANGTSDLGNDTHGVFIWNGAQNNTVGPGNVIAHNGDDGVRLHGGTTTVNTITQNSIFSNTMGINLISGANGGILPPTIMTTTVGSVNIVGEYACPYCTVEVFENSDTDGEGETYVGDTIADGSGNFTVTVSSLSQPYLTATATDETDGTSEFSDVFEATVELAPGSGPVYLPIIMRNN